MLLGLLVFLAVVAGLNRIADPFAGWRSPIVDRVYTKDKITVTRVITPYRLRTKEPITLLIGASRVLLGMPIEQGYRDGVLNASFMGAKLDEIAAVAQLAIQNPNLKRLIWGVEFFTFDDRFIGIQDPQMLRRLEGDTRLRVAETLLNMDTLEESWRLFLRAIAGRKRLPATRLVPVPWPEDIIRRELEEAGEHAPVDLARTVPKHAITQWVDVYSDFRLSAKQVALFRETITGIRQAGIEAIVFVPPLREYELEVIRQTGHWEAFQQWKRQLLAAGPYWDFSGYTELASTDFLYNDVAHFKPAVGNTILRLLLGKDCAQCGQLATRIEDAGVWVDSGNLDQHLAALDAGRIARAHTETRYSRAVGELIRRNAIPTVSQTTEIESSPDNAQKELVVSRVKNP